MTLVANFEQTLNGGPGSGPHPGMKVGKAYHIRAVDHEQGVYIHDTHKGGRGPSAKSPFSHFGKAVGSKRVYLGPPTVNSAVYETLTRNYSAPKSRKETLDGREYLVVPMTMIVPGVLNGSKGALFYPPEEVGKDPTPWNGMPITVYHPVRNGRNVSARDPEVLQSQGIGMVMRSRSGDKLRAEAWIDVAKAATVVHGDAILQNLRAGKPVEISTGLFTDNTEQAGEHNGKKYTHVARNYRPDHLAILPDQRGACSVDDGCGLMMNSNPEGHNQYSSLAKKHGYSVKKVGAKAKREYPYPHFAVLIHGNRQPDAYGRRSEAIKAANDHAEKHHGSSSTSNQEPVDNDWAEWNAKNRGKPKSPMAPKSDKAGKLAERASKLEGKHSAQGTAAREKAANTVKAHLAFAKSNAKMGDKKGATASFEKARKAAVGYSQTRMNQHAETAKAHAAAGNHAKAAHFQARADFHKSHVDKLRSAKMTHNSLMPTGEREFVMNQLALNVKGMSTRDVAAGGPGYAVNVEESDMLTANERQEVIGALIENSCGCWRVGDEAILGQFSDERLIAIAENNEAVVNALPFLTDNSNPTGKNQYTGHTGHRVVPAHTLDKVVFAQGRRDFGMKGSHHAIIAESKQGKTKVLGWHVDKGMAELGAKHLAASPTGNSEKWLIFVNAKKPDDEESEDSEDDEAIENAETLTANDWAEWNKTHGGKGGGHLSEMALKSSDYAKSASNKAKDRSGHRQAAESHTTAANWHKKAAKAAGDNKQLKESHLGRASTHESRASRHSFLGKVPTSNQEQEGENMADDKDKVVPVKLTRDEIWNMLDPADREAITNAHDIVTKAKAELVAKLTANVKDEATKTRLTANLAAKSLDELRDMEVLIPTPVQNKQQPPALRPVFGPTGNSFTTDPVSNDEDDVQQMVSPAIDWAELAKANDSRHRYANAN